MWFKKLLLSLTMSRVERNILQDLVILEIEKEQRFRREEGGNYSNHEYYNTLTKLERLLNCR